MSSEAFARPFPLAPLLEWRPATWTDDEWADVLQIPRRQMQRVRRRGCVTEREADRFAIALGLHPMTVWGDDWLQQLDTALVY